MPELIVDTSALIALHQVALLQILPALGQVVVVPEAVEQELATGRSEGHDVCDMATFNWAVFRTPTAKPVLPDANLLGPGESDVLWLALETPGSVAVLDEGPARRVASQLAIAFTGTLGLLLDAKHAGLIPVVAPVLAELERHDFRMSPHIRRLIMMAAGESP